MIVVGFLGGGSDAMAFEVARRGAATGARVEMVGAAAPGADGDRRLLELAAATVGHATVIRSGAQDLEPADLDLALRYLPGVRAIVLVRPPAPLIPTALAGADFTGAPLVLVGPLEPESLSAIDEVSGADAARPIVLDAPATDPDGTFAGFVAALAVRLDAGEPPESAFRATVSALAADPA